MIFLTKKEMENDALITDKLTEFEKLEVAKVSQEESLFADKIDNLLRHQDLQDREQDREQRKKYSYYIFIYICVYMLIVLSIVILTGARVLNLADSILIALLTTTTANVLGLFVIVTKYLFHPKS